MFKLNRILLIQQIKYLFKLITNISHFYKTFVLDFNAFSSRKKSICMMYIYYNNETLLVDEFHIELNVLVTKDPTLDPKVKGYLLAEIPGSSPVKKT